MRARLRLVNVEAEDESIDQNAGADIVGKLPAAPANLRGDLAIGGRQLEELRPEPEGGGDEQVLAIEERPRGMLIVVGRDLLSPKPFAGRGIVDDQAVLQKANDEPSLTQRDRIGGAIA